MNSLLSDWQYETILILLFCQSHLIYSSCTFNKPLFINHDHLFYSAFIKMNKKDGILFFLLYIVNYRFLFCIYVSGYSIEIINSSMLI